MPPPAAGFAQAANRAGFTQAASRAAFSQAASRAAFSQAASRAALEHAARIHNDIGQSIGASRQIAAARPDNAVDRAIANAAQRTSVDVDFLIAQAQVESDMNPNARARTSSATGLYQFIDSTWLSTMQRHGARFGMGEIATQIGVNRSGAAYVADPAARAAILELRKDPQIAALMAAGLAEDNSAHLTPILGRQPDHNELYLAHFLGAGGAGRFLSAMAENPDRPAASLFRQPAAANRPVFYQQNGQARSLGAVMQFLSAKLDRARANGPNDDLSRGSTSTVAPGSGPPNPPPYLIADEGVCAPLTPPTLTAPSLTAPSLTGANRPTIETLPVLSRATPTTATTMRSGDRAGSGAFAPGRRAMSGILQDTFGTANAFGSPRASEQIQRAYNQLKAFGL